MPESATSAAVLSSPSERTGVESRERGLPLRLGVLTEHIPPGLVDDAVAAAGAGARQRRGRALPAPGGGGFVLSVWPFCRAGSAPPPRHPPAGRGPAPPPRAPFPVPGAPPPAPAPN